MSHDITYKRGDSDNRPWGRWEVLDVGEAHIVKRITVEPGKILSLQRHKFRDEHWTIVRGTGRITIGDQELDKGYNESVFIPRGTVHRIENRTDAPVEFIEVQTGDALREDDIERLEDAYGRT
jgi:mannose-6-phosphate isomerase-like protein (cupin superfamily)